MSAMGQITSATLRGLHRDNRDLGRVVVSFDVPDGAVLRISLTNNDLAVLAKMIGEDFQNVRH